MEPGPGSYCECGKSYAFGEYAALGAAQAQLSAMEAPMFMEGGCAKSGGAANLKSEDVGDESRPIHNGVQVNSPAGSQLKSGTVGGGPALTGENENALKSCTS